MSTTVSEQINVFEFMALRSPVPVTHGASRSNYIHDDEVLRDGRGARDLFSAESASEFSREVYRIVFCSGSAGGGSVSVVSESSSNAGVIVAQPIENYLPFIQAVLQRLPRLAPACPHPQRGAIEQLRDRRYILSNEIYYLIPDELDQLTQGYARKARSLVDLLLNPPLTIGKELDLNALLAAILALLGATSIVDAVFSASEGRYSIPFLAAKRELFDRLYLLYVARRIKNARVSLQRTMLALGALHALEALAWDEVVAKLEGVATVPAQWTNLAATLVAVYPALQNWSRQSAASGFPLISNLSDLQARLYATPVVHPIFARLHRFRRPFNNVEPLGIGDLKVVKQWLCGYRAGEFAHVENVLSHEEKSRRHRRLERSQDTVSYTSESQEEVQQDQQSTDRFELKREAESVIHSDINVNARGSVTYKGAQVVAEVGAGMAYNRSQNDVSKSAENYSREVIAKAVKRIQNRVTQERSTTKVFEVEETNLHKLSNPSGQHISGIYCWLEKVYQAQLYNYGKRMMFEFVLPEPAVFLVESRMRAFEASLEVPIPPKAPTLPILNMPTVTLEQVELESPTQITKSVYDELRTKYDLSGVPYKPDLKTALIIDPATAEATLSRSALPDNMWSTATFRSNLKAAGYMVTKLTIDGFGHGSGRNEAEDLGNRAVNTIIFYVNGQEVGRWQEHGAEYFQPTAIQVPSMEYTASAGVPCHDDEVILTIGTMDFSYYSLTVSVELKLSADALLDWRTEVYNVVRNEEQKRVDAETVRLQQVYEGQLVTYKNRLDQLRAAAVNELLQGQAPARNQEVMRDELKRQCIAMLAKEFDADDHDDVLGKIDLVGSRDVNMITHKFTVSEQPNAEQPVSVSVTYKAGEVPTKYAAPRREPSQLYGRYIQFLEQAFEWNHLSFITYPYFWAHAPKWVELMNRNDQADPAFSSFLQAGSVKVLLAVVPAYDHAVLHFLATGEPWEGGPAPVIGDPLYVPLYEELHQQQDDLAGAVAEGTPWTFTVPTSLLYLENSSTPLPASRCPNVTL